MCKQMKTKFFTLLTMLVLCVGSMWATDITVATSTGTFYKDGTTAITPSSSNQYAKKWESTATSPKLTITCGSNNMIINSSDATDTKFRLHTDTYTMSVSSGYCITGYSITGYASNGTSKINNTTVGTTLAAATTVTVSSLTSSSASFSISGTANPWMYIKSFTVTVVEAVSVTYNVMDASSNILATTTVSQASGSAASLPSSIQNNFCTYGAPSVATVSEVNNEVNYTASLKSGFPFTYSTDYENATWYYWKLNGNYVSYSGTAPYEVSGTKPTTDAGLWAFIGTPYGTKIINKEAGSTKYLQANSNPEMTTTATEWVVANNTNKSNLAYFTVHSGANNYLNHQTTLKFWNNAKGATDNGSTFTVEEYSEDFAEDVATYITPYFNTHGSYFSIKDDVYSANSETWEDAKTTCTKDTYDELFALVSDADNIVWPATGLYLLKNYNSSQYLTATTTTLVQGETSDAPAAIVRLTKNDDGTYYIQLQGLYVQTPGQSSVTLGSTARKFTPIIGTATKVSLTVAGESASGYNNITTNGGKVCSFPARGISIDPQSYWSVEDATSISISLTAAKDNTSEAHTYATLCVPFNVTNLVGVDSKEVKAYAPTKSDNYIVPGDGATTITAGTPVMLIGEEGATTVTATIGSDYATSPATTNVLRGTFTNTSIDCTAETGTNYILGFDRDNDNRIGFYHVNSSSYNLKANRAYLDTTSEARGFYIKFDDVVTGISSMDDGRWTMDDESVDIYNLSGQRMNKMQKGINIVNGKKVLF